MFIFGKLWTDQNFFSEMRQLDEQRNEDRMRKVRKLFLKSRKTLRKSRIFRANLQSLNK